MAEGVYLAVYKIILKNFISLISAHIIYKLLLFFAFVLIARNLGVERFGMLSFAISSVSLFAIFLDFGLSELLVRDVSGKINPLLKKYVFNILGIKVILSIISCILLVSVSLIASKNNLIRQTILLLALCLIFDSLTIFLRSIFRLFEKMEIEGLSLVLEAIFKFGVIFLAVKYFYINILDVAYILFFISLAVLVLTAIMVSRRFINLSLNFDYKFYKQLLKKSLPFAFIAFFGVINFKITTLVISKMAGDITTGLYSAAIRLLEPILFIPVTAGTVLFSTASRLRNNYSESLTAMHKISLTTLLFLSIPIIIVINIFAKYIISIVFGKDYLGSITFVRILSFSLRDLS